MKTTIPKVPFEGFEQDNDHDRAEFFRQKNKEHFGGLMECAKEAQTLKTERDAALARAEAAEAEVARLRPLVEAAQRVVDAADACDREAERNHPSSRSSAPVVRAINAMKKLRAALLAARDGLAVYAGRDIEAGR